jgi:hypothetical protein
MAKMYHQAIILLFWKEKKQMMSELEKNVHVQMAPDK